MNTLKRHLMWILGGVLTALAIFLGVRPDVRASLSGEGGRLDFLGFGREVAGNEGYRPTKSEQREARGRRVRKNPVVGEAWRDLLVLLPPTPEIANLEVPAGGVPGTFEEECRFLSEIWGRRYGLTLDEEGKLAQELVEARTESWFETVSAVSSVSIDEKRYFIASSSIFESELWAEKWIPAVWSVLEKAESANREPSRGLADYRVFAAFGRQVGWEPEMVEQYFGELADTTPSPSEQEMTIGEVISGLREDEALFLLWVLPKLREVSLGAQ